MRLRSVLGIAVLVAAFGDRAGSAAAFDEGWLLTVVATAGVAAVCLFLPRPRKV
ncbi:hypothetical protein ACGFNU_32160 [Spirillospora sp. NPDC048911]|uniref:hypothetical protein n=1 Tax=Spirillospora sp. NPDC048911 TaxID=3364527 RepID=UPI0037234A59